MQITAQSIIEQVRFSIEQANGSKTDNPASVLRLTAALLLKQASDMLDAAEEANRD